ncbi:uncharacterized protein LOC131061074 [Cryptomeria japonica]|uniref:uncharacterized protein LOC131061074 n=1 Tax=Cryptomeria japonica TaxID=3369 RepID=UPI0027D9ED67|nr:uncharacterized protein LOC131061074 [Cryptomeria japonica]
MKCYVMDIFYTSSKLTYKLIRGSLDFYFFAGSSPLDVVQQFANLIGHTAAMAYWASGLSPLDAVQQFTDHRGHIAVMPYWASGMSIDALLYNFFGVALYCLLAFKYLQNLRIIYTSKAKVSAS